ncbi:MAG: hypothetical protein ACJ73E_10165 [Mycobacteriales bacterium]
MLLDQVLPRWDHRERHSVAVDAAPDAVWRAVEEVSWRSVPAFRVLTRLRSPGRPAPALDRPVLERMLAGGFTVLGRSADELVVGSVVRLAAPRGAVPLGAEPAGTVRGFDRPGHYKVALGFRLAGGRLSTETRVLATDPASRRAFGRYWLVVRLPGGLIRREWLRAIRRRAAVAGRDAG